MADASPSSRVLPRFVDLSGKRSELHWTSLKPHSLVQMAIPTPSLDASPGTAILGTPKSRTPIYTGAGHRRRLTHQVNPFGAQQVIDSVRRSRDPILNERSDEQLSSSAEAIARTLTEIVPAVRPWTIMDLLALINAVSRVFSAYRFPLDGGFIWCWAGEALYWAKPGREGHLEGQPDDKRYLRLPAGRPEEFAALWPQECALRWALTVSPLLRIVMQPYLSEITRAADVQTACMAAWDLGVFLSRETRLPEIESSDPSPITTH